MQHKEQPFESLCAFLQEQEVKQQTQQTGDNTIHEQLARATSQKVYEQQARLDRQGFWLFVLSMICLCQFLYVLTI